MRLHLIPFPDLVIPPNRQRRELNYDALAALAASIAEIGLIHPIVIRRQDDQLLLVAGERRLRALEYVWNFGQEVRCGDQSIPESMVPCLYLGELDPVEAFEIELEENTKRTDLTWQERAAATAQLAQLRALQAERDGRPPPTVADLAAEAAPSAVDTSPQQHAIRRDMILARNLEDADVREAKSPKEAMKILKRKEETARCQALGAALPSEILRGQHRLLRGDCLNILPDERLESFDVILTDPPYGINAQDFGDSGSEVGSQASHSYDDSPEAWGALMTQFLPLTFQVAKPQAHLYIFCDIDWFYELRANLALAGWSPFRTPLVWHNPSGVRAPWPESGPQRKSQYICYAVKGRRPCTRIYGDVLTYPQEAGDHPARKPPGLLADLLRRSCHPGDTVLDPFCGGGSIFTAAQSTKVIATGIELSETYYAMAAKRLEELK